MASTTYMCAVEASKAGIFIFISSEFAAVKERSSTIKHGATAEDIISLNITSLWTLGSLYKSKLLASVYHNMCKTDPIYRIADYCRTHVLAVSEPCGHYQCDKQFCPLRYFESCKAQQRQIASGEARGDSGIDTPCALCQLRSRQLFDSLSTVLIYIKARAGTQTLIGREANATGHWENAVRGQLNWEMMFYRAPQPTRPWREDQAAAGEIMRRILRQRWSME